MKCPNCGFELHGNIKGIRKNPERDAAITREFKTLAVGYPDINIVPILNKLADKYDLSNGRIRQIIETELSINLNPMADFYKKRGIKALELFNDGKTQKEITAELGLSRERGRQIFKKCARIMERKKFWESQKLPKP